MQHVRENAERYNTATIVLGSFIVGLITLASAMMVFRLIAPPLQKPFPERQTAPEAARNVCSTPGCITLAHQLSSWADPNVDPCVDFYKATCGKYIEHSAAEGTRNRERSVIISNLMKEIIRQNVTSPTPPSERNLRLLHAKCQSLKDPKIFPVEANKTLLEAMAILRGIGSWPVLDADWHAASFNLNEVLIRMAKLPMDDFGLFSFYPSRNLVITAPSAKSFLDANVLEETTLEMLKANDITNINKTAISEDIKDAKALFKRIQKLHIKTSEGRVPYARLKERVPSVDFDGIMKMVVAPEMVEWTVLEEKIVSTENRLFYGNTTNLETIITTSAPRTLANLLFFKFLSYISQSIVPSQNDDRDCVEFVIRELPQAALKLYVRHHFNRDNIRKVGELVDELRRSYADMILNSKWLSRGTKWNALQKLQHMKQMVGYPDGWEREVEEQHERLTILPADTLLTFFWKNWQFSMENAVQHIVADSLFDPTDRHLVMNANYNRPKNQLSITVAFIDSPNFDPSFPMYANLANIGKVLAHEIGHGYDAKGMTFDYNGQFKDWWTPKDKRTYLKKHQCIVDQYSNYDDPDYGRNLNGSKTIRETVADQLGNRVSWTTYRRTATADQPDIIGFEGHDADKMYFRIAALDWCAPHDTLPLDYRLKEVLHPTNSFRVNGVFSNMREFAETFQCPLGSPMNPKKKCRLF